jgi:hypothetical protein
MPRIASRTTVWSATYDVNVRMSSGCPLLSGKACGHPALPLSRPEVCLCAIDSTEDLEECPLEKHPVVLRRTPDWLDKAIDEATWKHSTES